MATKYHVFVFLYSRTHVSSMATKIWIYDRQSRVVIFIIFNRKFYAGIYNLLSILCTLVHKQLNKTNQFVKLNIGKLSSDFTEFLRTSWRTILIFELLRCFIKKCLMELSVIGVKQKFYNQKNYYSSYFRIGWELG